MCGTSGGWGGRLLGRDGRVADEESPSGNDEKKGVGL
jgi:hypothetical protein